jgi:penicillin-binding protein 1A
MRTFIFAALATPLLGGAVLFGLFYWAGEDLPSPRSFREVETNQKSQVLDAKGRVIQEFYVEDRVPIPLAEAPRAFIDAVIATEDRQFYRHWGMDLVSIFRALKADLLARQFTQGASTITQQLARNLFLTHRRTVLRKLREAVLAIRLERAFGKDEILELYVNQIYFGDGAYGLQAAARRFFGMPASELSIPQCALLAGILANPTAFSPTKNPDAALARRNRVLRSMKAVGHFPEEEYLAYSKEPLGLVPWVDEEAMAPYAAEMVRSYVVETYGPDALFRQGMTIHTTFDLELQTEAKAALVEQLERLEGLYGRPRPLTRSGRDTVGLGPLQGSVVAIDPETGGILTVVGGRDFVQSPFNRATQGLGRQPGSAFKPLIYVTALEKGWKSNDVLVDAPVEFEIIGVPEKDRYYRPTNFEETFAGPVVLRYALAKSINVVAVKLIDIIGPKEVMKLAWRLGIKSELQPVLSLALGAAEVRPLELAAAYATLAHHGIYTEPYFIESIEDRYGATLERYAPKSESVLDARVAFLATHLMQSVLDIGTGRSARSAGFTAPAAGKTGTTDDYTDAWFVGFTPDIVLCVWVGYDRKFPIGHKATGAVAALPAWTRIMTYATDRTGPSRFMPPKGIQLVPTCLDSGGLAGPYCPTPVEDAFLSGTEPVHTCNLHGPFRDVFVRGDAGTFREKDGHLFRSDPW